MTTQFLQKKSPLFPKPAEELIMAEKYLSPKKIEQEFEIDRKTIYHWCRNGDIVFFKKDKKILIPKTKFEQFLTNNLIDKRHI